MKSELRPAEQARLPISTQPSSALACLACIPSSTLRLYAVVADAPVKENYVNPIPDSVEVIGADDINNVAREAALAHVGMYLWCDVPRQVEHGAAKFYVKSLI